MNQINDFQQNAYQPNAPVAVPEHRSCFKCNYEGNVAQDSCPRCGKRLFTATNIRWRGFFLLVIGLFLSGLIGAIAVFVTVFLMDAMKDAKSAAKINHDTPKLIASYVAFGLVFIMGVNAIIMGVWQMIFGRRNRYMVWLFLALVVFTFFIFGAFYRGMMN